MIDTDPPCHSPALPSLFTCLGSLCLLVSPPSLPGDSGGTSPCAPAQPLDPGSLARPTQPFPRRWIRLFWSQLFISFPGQDRSSLGKSSSPFLMSGTVVGSLSRRGPCFVGPTTCRRRELLSGWVGEKGWKTGVCHPQKRPRSVFSDSQKGQGWPGWTGGSTG